MSIVDAIRADAAAILRDGQAKLVIGYRARIDRRLPVLLTNPDDVGLLVYDAQCKQNLAAYLRKGEVQSMLPAAIVARPAVIRSLLVLAAEAQVTDTQVKVLAVDDDGYHGVMDLAAAAKFLNEKHASVAPAPELVAQIKELAAMTPQQRAAFWSDQFARCTRCYACRTNCPGCYCQRCIVEKHMPQWISTVTGGHGNYAWNVIRAFHQAGRCTLCGACEAACPQGLPLMLLNACIDMQVADEFGYRPGYDAQGKPFIGSWNAEDDNDFVK